MEVVRDELRLDAGTARDLGEIVRLQAPGG